MSHPGTGDSPLQLSLAGQKILVVEDQYFIADEMACFLASAGSQVIGPAPDIASGLALLSQNAVDGAVLDIDLAGEEVFPLAVALRAKNVPWIYVTGYSSKPVPSDLKGRAYIEKPISRDAFLCALETLR
jgi:DNA-binding response OmpR family regulator